MKWRMVFLCALTLSLGGCATDKKKEPEKKPLPQGLRIIGRIAPIPADRRFVLIQSYGRWESEAGQIVTTRGENGRTANLKITGESLGEFAAADIQSGEVETGDAVYSQPKPQPSPSGIAPSFPPSPTKEILKNN